MRNLKQAKISRKSSVTDGNGEDRLSELPDGIICHIFSFLPTKESVATSILSTRYKLLYSSVPAIDLDFNQFYKNFECTEKHERDFIRMVDKLLVLRNGSNLKRFKMSFTMKYVKASSVFNWLCYALEHSVEILDIKLETRDDDIGFFPSEIFACKTLFVLKLETHFKSNIVIRVPESVDLPNLKAMYLAGPIFASDDYFLGKAFVGCRVLEELIIHLSAISGVHILDITIPSLEKLELWYCGGMDKIIIDTPSLLFLRFYGYLDKDITVKNLNSLVKADVYLAPRSVMQSEEGEASHVQHLSNAISAVSNTQSLTLNGDCFLALFRARYPWHPFQRLTHMLLDVEPGLFEIFPVILDSVPKLNSLGVNMITRNEDQRGKRGKRLKEPIRLSKYLKEVAIYFFYGDESDMQLVQYILKYGKVLRRLKICDVRIKSLKSQVSCFKKLLKLTRSSKTCRICFG